MQCEIEPMPRNHKTKVVYEVRTREGWRRAQGRMVGNSQLLRVTSEDGTTYLFGPHEYRIVPVAEEKAC